MLRMLEAVQYVRLRGERRRLTFRALDVEQIGYVYEGLLELEVRTASEPVIKLRTQGKKGVNFVGLTDALRAVKNLQEWAATAYIGESRATPSRLKSAANWLRQPAPPATIAGMRRMLGSVSSELEPLAPLVRCNERDRPSITSVGGRFVRSLHQAASTLAPTTRRAPLPRRSSATPWSLWFTARVRSKPSTWLNGCYGRPLNSSPCGSPTSRWEAVLSWSLLAATWRTDLSRPGTPRATPKRPWHWHSARRRPPTPRFNRWCCAPGGSWPSTAFTAST